MLRGDVQAKYNGIVSRTNVVEAVNAIPVLKQRCVTAIGWDLSREPRVLTADLS